MAELNQYGLPESEVFVPRTISNKDLGIPEFTVRKAKKKKPLYKKPQSVKDFELEHQEWMYLGKGIERSMWVYNKFSDNSANGLTKIIEAWFYVNGGFASRRNTMGTYSQKLGKYIRSGSTVGAEDVDGTIGGINVKIEVKIAKDRQSDKQKLYQKKIEDSGGIYFIVRNFDGFLDQIKLIYDI